MSQVWLISIEMQIYFATADFILPTNAVEASLFRYHSYLPRHSKRNRASLNW